MTDLDPRTTPATADAAAVELRGTVEAARYVRGTPRTVEAPLLDVLDAPRGARTSQILHGEGFRVIDERDGFAFGQGARDGYCGWVLAAGLGKPVEATHWVAAPATHLYPRPEVKAPPEAPLSFGAHVRVVDASARFARLASGHHVPALHLQPLSARFSDPVAVAELMLGTPYLWGGASRGGYDCSGLVQAALLACGIPSPRDSDQQTALGRPLREGEPPARGDLVFWDGHVGLMADGETLLHCNAYHMSAVQEPFAEARARIAAGAQGVGTGAVTGIRRLDA